MNKTHYEAFDDRLVQELEERNEFLDCGSFWCYVGSGVEMAGGAAVEVLTVGQGGSDIFAQGRTDWGSC